MRADRLVAVLLLIQRRGKVTVAEIADELEIAPRTARRDLEALALAGLPVYSTSGRHGGWQLAGGGKTDLSGLNAAEVQALFAVAGSGATPTPELRAALRKLVRALPETFRSQAEAAATSTVIDPRRWGQRTTAKSAPPSLDAVQHAVITQQQVELRYRSRVGEATTRLVEPLGVACRGGVWYLVGDTERGLRTFRVDRIASFVTTGQHARRPVGFDLSRAWDQIADHVEQLRTPFVATLSVDAKMLPVLRYMFGPRLTVGTPGANGRIAAELRSAHLAEAAVEIAGFGSAVVVDDPISLRDELRRVGRELTAQYAP